MQRIREYYNKYKSLEILVYTIAVYFLQVLQYFGESAHGAQNTSD